MSNLMPSVGRIVHYTKDEIDMAAIVTAVFDDGERIHLTVFVPGDLPVPVHNVFFGELNDQWHWPERTE